MSDRRATLAEVLARGPVVVNVGVRDFADALRAQGVPVVEVDWRPPATTDPDVARLLDKLL
jgi:hypothetical protein